MKVPDIKLFEPLDEEEAKIMAEVNDGEWEPVDEKTLTKMLDDGKKQAKKSLSKAGRISIRVTDNDLEGIKTLAVNAGIPAQTYIGMLVHKVATGQIELKNLY